CHEETFNNPSPNGQHTLNTGDGIRMAMEIGADLALSTSNCISDCACLSFDSMYGTLLVNPRGQRFVQENAHWGYLHTMVFNEAVKLNAANPEKVQFWIITDQNAMEKNLYFNFINNHQRRSATESYFDLVQKADTLDELANKVGLPTDALTATVDRWNQMVENGEDTDFQRRDIGAFTDLVKLGDGPYYALPYIPYSMGSFGGLRTDEDTRVINIAGEPIGRLYAAGAIMSGMYTAPFYNACGWSILGTVHWGRKAGLQMHALAPWTTDEVAVKDAGEAASVENAIASANGNYVPGSYTASAMGVNGEVPVTVEFSDKAIVSVTVGDNAETMGIGTIAIEKLPNQVILAQSADVDAVAGATITSNAILNAVQDCISQASK
ncbi:MAG: FAD-binding protein, partial [Clostridia bacterium]|nr:FAD-binding protein [Clostridia bacterium]